MEPSIRPICMTGRGVDVRAAKRGVTAVSSPRWKVLIAVCKLVGVPSEFAQAASPLGFDTSEDACRKRSFPERADEASKLFLPAIAEGRGHRAR